MMAVCKVTRVKLASLVTLISNEANICVKALVNGCSMLSVSDLVSDMAAKPNYIKQGLQKDV
jgi:hypothetical protein